MLWLEIVLQQLKCNCVGVHFFLLFNCNSNFQYTRLECMPKNNNVLTFIAQCSGCRGILSFEDDRTCRPIKFLIYIVCMCVGWTPVMNASHHKELKIRPLHSKPSSAEIDFSSSHRHRGLISRLSHAR